MNEKNKFEVGKWYKMSNANYIGKCEKIPSNDQFWTTEWINHNTYKKKEHYRSSHMHWKEIIEVPLEKIQQYLPKGHPDKFLTKDDLVEGEIYYSNSNHTNDYYFIFKFNRLGTGNIGDAEKDYIYTKYQIGYFNHEYFFDKKGLNSAHHNNLRLATQEEKTWLNACIKDNKFIPKEEALNMEDKKRGYYDDSIKIGKEITFDQFKKYVLKKNNNETKMELKTNVWYKHKYGIYYVYRTASVNNVGFDAHRWREDLACDVISNWTEAPIKEVEELLINEAKKRYRVGTVFKSAYINTQEYTVIKDVFYLRNKHSLLVNEKNGPSVFYEGKWAEIIENVKDNKVPTRISFYVKYCEEFTEDLYNKLWEWSKRNSEFKPRNHDDTYEGLKKYKFYLFDNWTLNTNDYNNRNTTFSYGVDNNTQGCKEEYSIEQVKKLINYKDPKSHPNNIQNFQIGEELYLIDNKLSADVGAKCRVTNNTRYYLDVKWIDSKANNQQDGGYNYDMFSRTNPLKKDKIAIHIINKDQWNFVSEKIGRTDPITFGEIEASECLREDIPNSSIDIKYAKVEGYTVLSFEEWLKLRNYNYNYTNNSQHLSEEAFDSFAVNVSDGPDKSLVEQLQPIQYEYNIEWFKYTINKDNHEKDQPIQLKKVKAIINKVNKY